VGDGEAGRREGDASRYIEGIIIIIIIIIV
jgi:hypothetical protein